MTPSPPPPPAALDAARRLIHQNDVEGLRQLLADHPALLSWRDGETEGGLLALAANSYGDSFDPVAEQHFTRAACAALLLDAGAFVAPSVCHGLLAARARGLIDLFHRRGLLPRTLKFFAALGGLESLRARLAAWEDGPAAVNEAFLFACHLQQDEAAALLLDHAIAADAALGARIDHGPGRPAFLRYLLTHKPDVHRPGSFDPWREYVRQQACGAMRDGDAAALLAVLREEPWTLAEAGLELQARLVEVAVLNGRAALLAGLLDLDPALLHAPAPPPSQAVEFAFTYARPRLLPQLLRIWPLPDDLPHAAGLGDLGRVRRWFDAGGRPALGPLARHYPATHGLYRKDMAVWFGSGETTIQRVLDTAFAWAVLNHRFEVAGFLLAHGADINTNWSSHEPASILHELVWHKNYVAMQFLIDRGIDTTILDHRWGATAAGWAAVAAGDEALAAWLHAAQQRRSPAAGESKNFPESV